MRVGPIGMRLVKLMLFSLLIHSSYNINARHRYIYLVKIFATDQNKNDLDPIAFYRGRELSFVGPIATIVSPLQFVFSIIVTPEVEFCTTTSSISCLNRKKGAPIRWFDLTLKIGSKNKWTWDIEELTLDKMSNKIPDHSIIIVHDPSLIEKIVIPKKVRNELSTSEGFASIIEFPKLILRNTDVENLCHINKLELCSIHEKSEFACKLLDHSHIILNTK